MGILIWISGFANECRINNDYIYIYIPAVDIFSVYAKSFLFSISLVTYFLNSPHTFILLNVPVYNSCRSCHIFINSIKTKQNKNKQN